MSRLAKLVLADNPGPMTLEGTNTWLVPDGAAYVVIDPGPLSDPHLDAITEAAEGKVSRILLTHGHPDHAEGAFAFAARVDAPIFAAAPAADVEKFPDRFDLEHGSITVLPTPGHTGDSTTFLAEVNERAALFTGDTVLGRGTTVLMQPRRALAEYLTSLEKLEWLASALNHRGIAVELLPGHGPTHADAVPVLAYYIDHRQERLDQVRALVLAGITEPMQLVERIYSDVPENVKAAALLSVQAQLEYLSDRA